MPSLSVHSCRVLNFSRIISCSHFKFCFLCFYFKAFTMYMLLYTNRFNTIHLRLVKWLGWGWGWFSQLFGFIVNFRYKICCWPTIMRVGSSFSDKRPATDPSPLRWGSSFWSVIFSGLITSVGSGSASAASQGAPTLPRLTHPRLSGTICDYLGLSRTIKDYLGLGWK